MSVTRLVALYLLAASPAAFADCPTGALESLSIPGLTPEFSPTVTRYTIPVAPSGSVSVTATPCDPSAVVFARSVRLAPGTAQGIWTADGGAIDVVLTREAREVGRYMIALDPTAPPAPPEPVIAALIASDMEPAFDPALTRYTVPGPPGQWVPVVFAVNDPQVRVYVQSSLVASDQVWNAWGPAGSDIDVVAYRNWVEVARYTLHVAEARTARLSRLSTEDAATLDAFFQAHPDAGAAFDVATTDLPSEGGDGTVPLEIEDARGLSRVIQVGGYETFVRDAAQAREQSSRPENLLGVYSMLRRLADGTPEFPEGALPSVDDAGRYRGSDLRDLNRALAGRLGPILASARNASPHVSPLRSRLPEGAWLYHKPCVGRDADLGNGAEGDLQTVPIGSKDCRPSLDGLIANDPRAYTAHLGCVRDQGNRGTCAGFAVASALETGYSLRNDTLVNLSEQKLYYRAKRDEQGLADGLNVLDLLTFLSWEDVKIPYESAWNYNPAPNRQKAPCSGSTCYEDSCLGYGEACSDTVHQGERYCSTKKSQIPVCSWTSPKDTAGLMTWAPHVQLWDADDPQASIEMMKGALTSGTQIVLSVMVNDSFMAAIRGNGFIDYNGDGESSYGSHALHLVGYVDNTELAIWAPKAPPGDFGMPGTKGEGGYFIARNSWGPCAGDGGYIYLPYRWMKPYFFVTSAVTVEPDGISMF